MAESAPSSPSITDSLCDCLRRCCAVAVDLPLPSQVNSASSDAQNMRMQLLSVDPSAQKALADCLEGVPGLAKVFGGTMWAGRQGWRVFASEVQKWAVMRAIDVGPEQAACELMAFGESNGATVHDFFALAGVRVVSAVAINSAIRLVPFDDVPRGAATDKLIGVPILSPPPNVVSFDADNSPPTAVLARARWKAPLVGSPGGDDCEDLFDAALSLVLVGPSVVFVRSFWTWLPDSVPLACTQSGGTEFLPEVQVPHYELQPRIIEAADLEPVRQFLLIERSLRARLRLPLQRLCLSLMRRALVDKAIELGIAFESLLIGGEREEQLVKTGMYRVAVLHGGGKEEREQAMSLYEAFYDIRSQAVHTGTVDPTKEYKVKRVGKLRAQEVMTQAQGLGASLIRKLIATGKLPDWSRVFPGGKEIALTAKLP